MKNAFIVLLVLLPLLQACNLGNDALQPNPQPVAAEQETLKTEVISATEWQSRYASLAVSDGVLQFESPTQFYTLIKQFSFLTAEEQSRVSQRPGFTSYQAKYAEVIQSLQEATDEQAARSILAQHPHIVKVVDETIRPTLGEINRGIDMLLNEKGFVSINGVMHLYNEAGTFVSKTADVSEIERAALSGSSTSEVEAYLHPAPIASGTRASCNSFTQRDDDVVNQPNQNRRVFFRIYTRAFTVGGSNNNWTVQPNVTFYGIAYQKMPFGYWVEYSATHHKEYSITARVQRRPSDGSKWDSFWHKTTYGPAQRSWTLFDVGNQISGVSNADLHLFVPTVEYSNSLHSHDGMNLSNL
ncbi:MAG: hypothetical protein AAFQ68_11395, partial [Bacteroidota bacterium]